MRVVRVLCGALAYLPIIVTCGCAQVVNPDAARAETKKAKAAKAQADRELAMLMKAVVRKNDNKPKGKVVEEKTEEQKDYEAMSLEEQIEYDVSHTLRLASQSSNRHQLHLVFAAHSDHHRSMCV